MSEAAQDEVGILGQSVKDLQLVATPARKTKPKLPTRGVKSQDLEHWINLRLDDVGISKEAIAIKKGITYAMQNCYFRVRTTTDTSQNEVEMDRRNKTALRNHLEVLTEQVPESRGLITECDSPEKIERKFPCECSVPCKCYSKIINKSYHKLQNDLLDIPELDLAEHRPDNVDKSWMIANDGKEVKLWMEISFKEFADMILKEGGEEMFKEQFMLKSSGKAAIITAFKYTPTKKEASLEEFEKIIDDKITKSIWNKRDKIIIASRTWLKTVQKILQNICLLRLESQWLISNDIAYRRASVRKGDHLTVLVCLMTALVVVHAVTCLQ